MGALKPVNESILEINDNMWIIGDRILLSKQPVAPSSGCFWSDGGSAFYSISEVPSCSPLRTRPLSSTSPLRLVHSAGDCNAAWRIGEAYLKVQVINIPSRTREHTTLNYLHASGLTFPIPHALYHTEYDNRYYLFTSRVPGVTLEKAWPNMDESMKQACVRQVINICRELAKTENDRISGVDGSELSEDWMKPPHTVDGYSHEVLLSYCKEIKMDCSKFVLHHCDMGPTNVIVDLAEACTVGLVDWEVTGFVPKGWIRTKFCICWAMDFNFPEEDVEASKDWRQRVQLHLGYEGFTEVADAWKHRFWRTLNIKQ
jgi:aminoglycoside phosphotransferase